MRFTQFRRQFLNEGYSANNTINIPVRIELQTGYAGISGRVDEGNIDKYDGYFKQVIDLLNLNPLKLKETMISDFNYREDALGEFPDMPERNGQEYVKYETFVKELRETMYHSFLTFVGYVDWIVDTESYYNEETDEFEYEDVHFYSKRDEMHFIKNMDGSYIENAVKVQLKENTRILFHDSFNGSCSIGDMLLLRPMELITNMPRKSSYDKLVVLIDSQTSYGVQEVIGDDSLFDEEIKIVKSK